MTDALVVRSLAPEVAPFMLLLFALLYLAMTHQRGLSVADHWRSCESLGPWACMHRSGCVLELASTPPGSGYRCRAPANDCERDLPAYVDEDYPAQCAERSSCVWRDAPCFCGCAFDPARPCSCVCGGGPPGRCEPKP